MQISYNVSYYMSWINKELSQVKYNFSVYIFFTYLCLLALIMCVCVCVCVSIYVIMLWCLCAMTETFKKNILKLSNQNYNITE